MTVASPMTSNKCPLGDDCDLLIAYQHGADSMKDQIRELQEERDKLKSILGRYASGVGAAEGVFFENYGSLEKDEQALVRTLADIWENA